jgi:hypothetical protein
MVFFVSNLGKYILMSPGLHKRLFQTTALNPLLLHTEDVLFSWRIWIHILNMDPDPVGKMNVDPDLTLKPPPTRLIYCRPHNDMIMHTK